MAGWIKWSCCSWYEVLTGSHNPLHWLTWVVSLKTWTCMTWCKCKCSLSIFIWSHMITTDDMTQLSMNVGGGITMSSRLITPTSVTQDKSQCAHGMTAECWRLAVWSGVPLGRVTCRQTEAYSWLGRQPRWEDAVTCRHNLGLTGDGQRMVCKHAIMTITNVQKSQQSCHH